MPPASPAEPGPAAGFRPAPAFSPPSSLLSHPAAAKARTGPEARAAAPTDAPSASLKRWLAPAIGRRGEARSLFGEILDWMFAPLLLLWPMSVSITYLVARSIASSPYDHALIERGETLAAHVRFEGNRARFDLSPGLEEIYGTGVSEPGSYLVVDGDGKVLVGDRDLPRPRTAPVANKAGIGENSGLAVGDGFLLRDDTLRGHAVRVAYTWVAPPATSAAGPTPDEAAPAAPAVLIEVAESPAERTQLANEIIKGVILPQFVVLPLALVLVWFGLTRGLAPLSRLQRTIRNRAPEDLSPIKVESAPEELAPLLASFNELLGRMAHNLEVQKRFIADAAHQMKTPLAGLRTQAELALREGDANELQRSLRQIAESTERATRMVNQLLALARAEHGAGETAAMVRVDLDQLARSTVQDWVTQALAQDIDLGYEAPDGDCHIRGTPMLLREMLNNLIDNAMRYCSARIPSAGAPGLATPAAAVEQSAVTVRLQRSGQTVVLEVEDTGPGIAPDEREQVFERFYRILGTQKDGSGLGLAIVREIAAQHRAALLLTDAHPREAPERAPEPAAEPAGAHDMALSRRPGARFRITFEHSPEAAER
jgi:two-component system sensor histidine kinase TctE